MRGSISNCNQVLNYIALDYLSTLTKGMQNKASILQQANKELHVKQSTPQTHDIKQEKLTTMLKEYEQSTFGLIK